MPADVYMRALQQLMRSVDAAMAAKARPSAVPTDSALKEAYIEMLRGRAEQPAPAREDGVDEPVPGPGHY